MPELPQGTVAFLFTDIEASTERWERDRQTMGIAVTRHIALLNTAIQAHGGVHFKTVGDAVQAAFPTAPQALAAAVDGQRALLAEDWGEVGALQVRMALHAGEAIPDDRGDYLAAPLNRLSRLLSTGYGGQILLSQTVQQLSRGALPAGTELRDLGEHRLKDLLEPERVWHLVAPDLEDAFPPLQTLDARPNNLPHQPTPFLGREREVEEVVDLLRRQKTQLLTLTGPGGTGKTRLGLQVAAEVLEDFVDGVFFVSLSALTDPTLVPMTIADTLAIREEGERPLQERLLDILATKHLLLVLDNLEQVPGTATFVSELLSSAPGLTVLATSRVPLRLRAEREYLVPPLGLPRRKPPPTLQQMTQFEAVRLFIERAQAVKPGFVVDNANAPAIAEICHRLDGLPLAIELAAARIRILPPQKMLTRLEQRLPLLTGGAHDLPVRQQTLRGTIAWSYELLGLSEQVLFQRLAVFAGGWTLEAAEAVAGSLESGELELDVLEGLERLVAQNLLRQAEGVEGEPRFSMLETIREFGLEQLEAAGELEEARQRHADVIVTLVEDAEPHLTGHEQQRWMNRLEVEHDNIRSVLTWAAEHDPQIALRIAGALWRFWAYRGHFSEGRGVLDRLLQHPDGIPPAILAKAFDAASGLAWGQGDLPAAQQHAEASLALYRNLDDTLGIANALQGLGVSFGDADDAGAITAFEEELVLRRELGDQRGTGVALSNLGELTRDAGDAVGARAYYTEALAALQSAGDRTAFAWVLAELGLLDLQAGDLAGGTRIAEALHIFNDLGHQYGVSMAIDRCALFAEKMGQHPLAARLFGAADALREAIGAARQTTDRSWYDQTLEAVRTALGTEAFDVAWNAGRAVPLEDVIPEASVLAHERIEVGS